MGCVVDSEAIYVAIDMCQLAASYPQAGTVFVFPERHSATPARGPLLEDQSCWDRRCSNKSKPGRTPMPNADGSVSVP